MFSPVSVLFQCFCMYVCIDCLVCGKARSAVELLNKYLKKSLDNETMSEQQDHYRTTRPYPDNKTMSGKQDHVRTTKKDKQNRLTRILYNSSNTDLFNSIESAYVIVQLAQTGSNDCRPSNSIGVSWLLYYIHAV